MKTVAAPDWLSEIAALSQAIRNFLSRAGWSKEKGARSGIAPGSFLSSLWNLHPCQVQLH